MTTMTDATITTPATPTPAAPAPSAPPIKLLQALAKAKSEFGAAGKSMKNSHFGNAYATLEDVLAAVEPALLANGLVLVQQLQVADPRWPTLLTQLWHVSGERIETSQILQPARSDAHSLAGAVTYFRRTQIKTMLCIAETDDDGNEASGAQGRMVTRAAPKPAAKPEAKPAAETPASANVASDAAYDEMTVCAKIGEIDSVKDLQAYLQAVVPHLDAPTKKVVRQCYDERYAALRG